ncbi:uncharacterized protein LOC142986446 [Anticarsia gemmatalis]|uniref:uncharacterized protein LOC142986446 n=1 Tax=Anticarsia gemmatalis TaxID=129554 RepID=UPI003F75EA79
MLVVVIAGIILTRKLKLRNKKYSAKEVTESNVHLDNDAQDHYECVERLDSVLVNETRPRIEISHPSPITALSNPGYEQTTNHAEEEYTYVESNKLAGISAMKKQSELIYDEVDHLNGEPEYMNTVKLQKDNSVTFNRRASTDQEPGVDNLEDKSDLSQYVDMRHNQYVYGFKIPEIRVTKKFD